MRFLGSELGNAELNVKFRTVKSRGVFPSKMEPVGLTRPYNIIIFSLQRSDITITNIPRSWSVRASFRETAGVDTERTSLRSADNVTGP